MVEIGLEMDLSTTRMEIGETLEILLVIDRQRRDFSQKISYRQPRVDQPNKSVIGRNDNSPPSGFTNCGQKLR